MCAGKFIPLLTSQLSLVAKSLMWSPIGLLRHFINWIGDMANELVFRCTVNTRYSATIPFSKNTVA